MHKSTSIRLKFRPSSHLHKEGALYFQIIHNRSVKRVGTEWRILPSEWENNTDTILLPPRDNPRYERLLAIRNDINWQINRFHKIATVGLTIDEVVARFQGETADGNGVFDYIQKQSELLERCGRKRCSETMATALRSFMRFRGGIDLSFSRITRDIIEEYEGWLKGRGLTRNSTSFYMRTLRTAYNQAVEDGLTVNTDPFRKVYTGVDKSIKRAISLDDVKRIRSLDLSRRPALDFARDMLLFSFFTRGMSFIDMAYLRKRDAVGGRITYRRRKTGHALTVEIAPQLQEIVSKYQTNTQYLLPIITAEDGSERTQYQNSMMCVNRNLKKIGELVQLAQPLSTYTARHAWATIAREKNVPLAVISEGLGHDSEKTTQIYLDSIHTSTIDEANRLVLADL